MAFTLGMQGGNPFQLGADQPWLVSAFNPDGSLKQAWLDRADRVIRAADRSGLVVILQYFYQHQEDRFINDAAVLRAADNISGTATTPQTDLYVTSTDSPDPVSGGASVTYRITVSNAGASNATGVTLTDKLPASVLFVSASTGCAELGGVVTCNIGGLVTGGTAVIEIVLAPTANGVFSNAVRVTGNEADTNPVNNAATEQTTVNVASAPMADLSVSTIDSPDPAPVGNSLTYRVTVANGGPDSSTGVTLTDTLPAGVTFGSASAECAQSGGVVVCNEGGLTGGGSRSSSITVTPTAQGTISNTAQVSGSENDPDTANNSDLQQTTVSAISALTCGGRTPTILGTANSETLVGTAGADVIHGLGGADIIRGGGGKDIICGGDGKDRLFGDTGTDKLDGGAGVDNCDGGAPTSGDTALNCEQSINVP